MINWIINNKEWVFSGVGIASLGLVATWLLSNNEKKASQIQKSGDNSINIQNSGKNSQITVNKNREG